VEKKMPYRITFILLGTLVCIAMLVSANSAPNTTIQQSNNEAMIKTTSGPIDNATDHTATIVLGAGCFWGAEKRYAAIPGVIDAVSGYADGRGFEPTYRNITLRANRHNPDTYAELVQGTNNPIEVSLEAILRVY